MHIEVLTEDHSGEALINLLMPKILGDQGNPHTWRIHSYKGVGHIPKNLSAQSDAAKKMLLNKLPALLRGMAKTAGIDAVVVVLDNDTRDCRLFLSELKSLANHSAPALNCLFRLAVEELEAWYLGDREALKYAYPGIKLKLLDNYAQDASCGTWELLADAIFPGGPKAVAQAGWPCPGIIKHEWAEKIGPAMSLEANVSPSFGKFRDGLRRLAAAERP